MIQIEDQLISMDVVEKRFTCDIKKCKGACCVQGDSGAPLEEWEAGILEKLYPSIKPYLRRKGIKAIEKQGVHVVDSDGDVVTPLVDNKECAYAIFEDGIALCGIEKAYDDGKTDFQKPLSCHLYPIRAKKYEKFEGLNYDEWDICKPALVLGSRLNKKVYEFVKDALIRKYGEEWYRQLSFVTQNLESKKKK